MKPQPKSPRAPAPLPPIVFVTHRYETHAAHSGYDRLAERISAERVNLERLERLARPVPDRVFSWLRARSGVANYARRRALLELGAAMRFLVGGRRIFHFLYADYTFRYLGSLPNLRGHTIVGSFHLPPSVLERTLREPRYLSRLDRVIILGECQRAFFRRYVADERIVRIPYFVDTEFFHPGNGGRDPDLCLFVGYYLRDVEGFGEAVRELVRRRPALRFTVVVRQSLRSRFDSLPHTEVLSDLPDTDLRALYQRASLLVLPLEDAVANNSILEAMACGLPVVASDVGAVAEYVGPEAGFLVPRGDPASLVEEVDHLLATPSELLRASAAARARAVDEFSLPGVAARVEALLREAAGAQRMERAETRSTTSGARP